MSRSSRLRRTIAPVLLAAVLVAGCGSGEESADPVDGDTGGPGGNADQVSAAGLSFEAPEGWDNLDPDQADIPDDEAAGLAEGLGMTAEQLQETIRNVDLFLVDGEGPQGGFLANINVVGQQGAMPGDGDLESQFAAIGAQVNELSHTQTEAGDAAVVDYTLAIGDRTIEGVSYLIDLGDEIVTVTVSTPDRAETDEIADAIGDSLTEAS